MKYCAGKCITAHTSKYPKIYITCTRRALRDLLWWEKTGKIHALVAAQVIKASALVLSSVKLNTPIVVTLCGTAADTVPTFSTSKQELRTIEKTKDKLESELILQAGQNYEEYANLLDMWQSEPGDADVPTPKDSTRTSSFSISHPAPSGAITPATPTSEIMTIAAITLSTAAAGTDVKVSPAPASADPTKARHHVLAEKRTGNQEEDRVAQAGREVGRKRPPGSISDRSASEKDHTPSTAESAEVEAGGRPKPIQIAKRRGRPAKVVRGRSHTIVAGKKSGPGRKRPRPTGTCSHDSAEDAALARKENGEGMGNWHFHSEQEEPDSKSLEEIGDARDLVVQAAKAALAPKKRPKIMRYSGNSTTVVDSNRMTVVDESSPAPASRVEDVDIAVLVSPTDGEESTTSRAEREREVTGRAGDEGVASGRERERGSGVDRRNASVGEIGTASTALSLVSLPSSAFALSGSPHHAAPRISVIGRTESNELFLPLGEKRLSEDVGNNAALCTPSPSCSSSSPSSYCPSSSVSVPAAAEEPTQRAACAEKKPENAEEKNQLAEAYRKSAIYRPSENTRVDAIRELGLLQASTKGCPPNGFEHLRIVSKLMSAPPGTPPRPENGVMANISTITAATATAGGAADAAPGTVGKHSSPEGGTVPDGRCGIVLNAEHARKIELARFVECQRRELEEEKRLCREELAPLEAELDSLKRKLRGKMKDVSERHACDRLAFQASLYGTHVTGVSS